MEPKTTKPAAKAPPSPPLYTKADLELPPLEPEPVESNAPDRSMSDEPNGVETTPPPPEPPAEVVAEVPLADEAAPPEAAETPPADEDAPPAAGADTAQEPEAKADEDAEEESGSEEEEEEEPLVKWPEGKDPYVNGRLYGRQAAPPTPVPGKPIKAVLSCRPSYGSGDIVDADSALGPLMPFCPYCLRLGLWMREAGVEFETYLIDAKDKPEWFLEGYPAGTTPAILGTPGGVSQTEWAGETSDCIARMKEQSDAIRAWSDKPAADAEKFTVDKVSALFEATGFACVGSLIADTADPAAIMLLGFLGQKFEDDEPHAARKERVVKKFLDGVSEMETLIASLDGKFIGGDEPCVMDVYAITMLYFTNNATELGFCGAPQAPCSLADLGAPSLLPYIRLWMQRESFEYCYQHTNEISAASAINILKMLADKAHDVTNDGEVYAKIMARARERDPVYDGIDHTLEDASPESKTAAVAPDEPTDAIATESLPEADEAPTVEEETAEVDPEVPAEAVGIEAQPAAQEETAEVAADDVASETPPADEDAPPAAGADTAQEPEAKADEDAEEESGSEEEEEEEPLVKWPEGKDPYVNGRLYGRQAAPPTPVPGKPIKAVLSCRPSYGSGDIVDADSALGPLMPFCPYCLRLGLWMREAGVEFETYLIDAKDKPEWFLEGYPAGTTPAILGTPGGVSQTEWAGETSDCIARMKEQSDAIRAWSDKPAADAEKFTVDKVSALFEATGFACVGSLIADTADPAAIMLLGFLGQKFEDDEPHAARKERVVKKFLDGVSEMETLIASLDGKFIGGDEPCVMDVYAITMLYFTNNATELGFCGAPQAPCSLADLGAPSLLPYIRLWMQRESFEYCYQHTNEISAASAINILKMLADKAHDVTNDGEVYAKIMARARERDPVYDGIDHASAAA